MTNEEKAIEKLCKNCNSSLCDYKHKKIKSCAEYRAYLDGLAEGRKEVYEELQWVTDTDNYIASKLERLKELEKENKICEEIIIGEQQEINRLEKENAELKEQNQDFWLAVKNVGELRKEITELKEQIEKMKCCDNCKNRKGWKGEKPCLDCKYNPFGEGTEDKWEPVE